MLASAVARHAPLEQHELQMPTNLFVNYLPKSVGDVHLLERFQEYGVVLSAKIMVDPRSGKTKGYGFVLMSTEVEAQRCVQKLDGTHWDGKTIRVKPSDNPINGNSAKARDSRPSHMHDKKRSINHNLYVKGFPPSWDKTSLRQHFQPYGDIQDTIVLMGHGKSKCVGFVCFRSVASAQRAVEDPAATVVPNWTRPLMVLYAQHDINQASGPSPSPGSSRGQRSPTDERTRSNERVEFLPCTTVPPGVVPPTDLQKNNVEHADARMIDLLAELKLMHDSDVSTPHRRSAATATALPPPPPGSGARTMIAKEEKHRKKEEGVRQYGDDVDRRNSNPLITVDPPQEQETTSGPSARAASTNDPTSPSAILHQIPATSPMARLFSAVRTHNPYSAEKQFIEENDERARVRHNNSSVAAGSTPSTEPSVRSEQQRRNPLVSLMGHFESQFLLYPPSSWTTINSSSTSSSSNGGVAGNASLHPSARHAGSPENIRANGGSSMSTDGNFAVPSSSSLLNQMPSAVNPATSIQSQHHASLSPVYGHLHDNHDHRIGHGLHEHHDVTLHSRRMDTPPMLEKGPELPTYPSQSRAHQPSEGHAHDPTSTSSHNNALCPYCSTGTSVLVNNMPYDEARCQLQTYDLLGMYGAIKAAECLRNGQVIVTFADYSAAAAAVASLMHTPQAVTFYDCTYGIYY